MVISYVHNTYGGAYAAYHPVNLAELDRAEKYMFIITEGKIFKIIYLLFEYAVI